MKNLQRLQGIDGDYDNDSGSGPDRIARRKTIQNLDKAAKPRRQIGTLDVAFKKRFLQLTADENNPSELKFKYCQVAQFDRFHLQQARRS